jgi:hypothetical protein
LNDANTYGNASSAPKVTRDAGDPYEALCDEDAAAGAVEELLPEERCWATSAGEKAANPNMTGRRRRAAEKAEKKLLERESRLRVMSFS